MSYDFNYNPFRTLILISVVYYLDHNLMPVHGTKTFTLRNENIPGEFLVVRHHKAIVLIFLIKSDNLTRPTFNNPDNLSFTPSRLSLLGCNNYPYHITMKSAVNILFRYKDIILTLNHNKTEAPLCALKNTG